MFLRKGAFFKFQVLLCTVLSITLLYHVFKTSDFPQVAAFDEQLHGTGVILFSRLHMCETLISQTPVYPLIYSSCSIIKHQHYVCTSQSVIIDPLINCLQDIIMHIRCEMQSTYARSVLMGTTTLGGGREGGGIEQINCSFAQTNFHFPATLTDAPSQNIFTGVTPPVGVYC